MKALNGIIDKAEFYSSPNCDSRPDNIDIDLFVIHAISLPPGNYNTQLIKDLFLNNLDPRSNEFLKSIENSNPNPVLEIVGFKSTENLNPNPVLEIVGFKPIKNSNSNPVLEIAITTKMRSG